MMSVQRGLDDPYITADGRELYYSTIYESWVVRWTEGTDEAFSANIDEEEAERLIREALIESAVELAKREIRADVKLGRVPTTVTSFSELHDYVDANEYGGLCDDGQPGMDHEDWIAWGNDIQTRVDSWIKGGGLHSILYEVEVTLGRMKVEHVGEALRRLQAVVQSFDDDGVEVDASYSVERGRDGVERWHTWVDEEGRIKDIQPWEEV